MAKHKPQKYEVNGRTTKCSACGNELFYERKEQEILDGELDVINRTCSECGHIMFFDPYPGAP